MGVSAWLVGGVDVGRVYYGVHRALGGRRGTCVAIFGSFTCLLYGAMVGTRCCRPGHWRAYARAGRSRRVPGTVINFGRGWVGVYMVG